MNKRHFLFITSMVMFSIIACGSQETLKPPAGSSGYQVPLFPGAQRISISETDSASFIKEILGSGSLLYSSSTNISWTKDTGMKVKEELDKLLPDSNWRLESDWSGYGQFYVSKWRNGDLRVIIAYLDNLDSEQISELNRRYGISVPETGTTLIVTHLWDASKPIPTATSTNTPIPSSTPIPSATRTPPPTYTPLPSSTPLPSPTPVNFREEFNGQELNADIWEQVGPPIRFQDGKIILESSQSPIAPYVYAKQNLFPYQGNFEVEISFRYIRVEQYGGGLIISNKTPSPGTNLTSNDIKQCFVSFFQDKSNWTLAIYHMGIRVFEFPSPDLLQHTIKLQFDGKYTIFVDGNLVYKSNPTNDRPTTIWFGEPSRFGDNSEWTSFEIDYIYIRSIP